MPRFAALACLALVAGLCGCEATPKPRGPRHPQPVNIVATQLLPAASYFTDTDGNGYFDTVEVTVHVFAESYPESSVNVPGAFTFRLIAKDGRLLRAWEYDQKATDAARRIKPVGPAYIFQLSLIGDPPGDMLTESTAELTTSFKPATGPTLTAPSNSVRLGRASKM